MKCQLVEGQAQPGDGSGNCETITNENVCNSKKPSCYWIFTDQYDASKPLKIYENQDASKSDVKESVDKGRDTVKNPQDGIRKNRGKKSKHFTPTTTTTAPPTTRKLYEKKALDLGDEDDDEEEDHDENRKHENKDSRTLLSANSLVSNIKSFRNKKSSNTRMTIFPNKNEDEEPGLDSNNSIDDSASETLITTEEEFHESRHLYYRQEDDLEKDQSLPIPKDSFTLAKSDPNKKHKTQISKRALAIAQDYEVKYSKN